MAWFWTNQLTAITNASGKELKLLRVPGESEEERTGMYFKPAMYYSVSAKSEHPEEAALLVDFLLNDPAAGEILLSDRGLPGQHRRPRRRAGQVLAHRQAGRRVPGRPRGRDRRRPASSRPWAPVEVAEITRRINQEVLFGRLSPADAAKQYTQEVEAAIGG